MEEFLWAQKYRPKTVQDTILTPELKATFKQFVDQKNIPNLLLSGPPGIGKTTIAIAMLEELQCDYIVINGSLNGNIDTLRNEISSFASAISFGGGRKYIILDEADYLNANSTQPALRNFMEEFSKYCGFILTCNFVNRIIEPLQSRCSIIDFNVSKQDRIKLASAFLRRACYILDEENIQHDKAVVAQVVEKFFPDWRRVLNELQRYSATGSIDSGILVNLSEESVKQMFEHLKERRWKEMRKWVNENLDSDTASLYRTIYDAAEKYIKPNSIPMTVVLLAKYQYQQAFVADAEVNFVALLTEIMVNVEFI